MIAISYKCAFRLHYSCVLLATDVAARGLDIPKVQHVIHYQVGVSMGLKASLHTGEFKAKFGAGRKNYCSEAPTTGNNHWHLKPTVVTFGTLVRFSLRSLCVVECQGALPSKVLDVMRLESRCFPYNGKYIS